MNNPNNTLQQDEMIRVGVTHGDINGISYEVIIKALMDSRILEMMKVVVYGHAKVASYYKKGVGAGDFNFNIIKHVDQAVNKKANMINIYDNDVKIEMGKVTPLAGELAYISLEKAIEDYKNGNIDVVVTAPINKSNLQSEKFNFPGHTEYFAQKFDTKDFMMLMVSEKLRIGVITGHVPLKEVPSLITEETIISKIKVLNQSLIKDFSVRKPKIAVLGLNPHAGEDGLLGDEEQKTIIPALEKCNDEGILAYGPYPADGLFATNDFLRFDAILAMYHDQGLIPFKSIGFQNGVNYTAGLPVVRTSPAHGTAYEITGKNQASPDSFRSAMYLAVDIYKNRKQHEEISSDQLQYHLIEEENSNNSKNGSEPE